jgi:hypothetical protein
MGKDAKINPQSAEYQGSGGVLDCRGRELQVGDELIVVLNGPTYVRVAAIAPELDPKAPPGMMRVSLGALYQFYAPRGQRNTEFVRVQTVQEAGPLTPPPAADAGPKLKVVE